jgi:hypothetical protein
VEEYTEEFYKLLTRVDLSELDDQLVSQYIEGLWSQIQDTLNLFDLTNVLEAYQRALLIEKTLVRGPLGMFGRGGNWGYNRLNGPNLTRGTTQPAGQGRASTSRGHKTEPKPLPVPSAFDVVRRVTGWPIAARERNTIRVYLLI